MKARLNIDLGQSQIRGILKVGEIKTEERVETIFVFDNSFAKVLDKPQRYVGSTDYSPENSSLLKLDPTRQYGKGFLPDYVCSGDLKRLEFSLDTMKTSNRTAKVYTPQSYYAIMTLIVKSLNWIAENNLLDTSDIEKVAQEVEFELSLLLPPTQKDRTAKEFTNMLLGTHNIASLIPSALLKVRIEKVTFEQEGIVSYMALMLRKGTFTPREEISSRLKDSVVLILDMGASTVDLVVINKGITLENSRHTITAGGNTVLSKLKTVLAKYSGRKISDQELFKVSQTGTFYDGNSTIALEEDVSREKQMVADSIISSIADYLDSVSFDIGQVNTIIPIGGNLQKSESDKIRDLGSYIIDELKLSLPDAEVLDLNNYDFSDLSVKGAEGLNFDRLLNIYGLALVSELKEIKELQIKKANEPKYEI